MSAVIAIDATGRGDPLVLLHGVGANRGIWHRVTPPLASERLVLTVDLPGFGESAAMGGKFQLDEVAIAIAEALADQGHSRFDLVGNSLGGAIALLLARRRAELVRRLILVAPAGFSPRPWLVSTAAGNVAGTAVTARRVLGTPLARLGLARRVLLWGAVAAPQHLPAGDARAMLRASRGSGSIGAAIASVLRADLREELRRLDAPLGFIWGERDRIIPIATLRELRAVRPEAVIEAIPDAAHVPQIERPAAFIAALRRVLERL